MAAGRLFTSIPPARRRRRGIIRTLILIATTMLVAVAFAPLQPVTAKDHSDGS